MDGEEPDLKLAGLSLWVLARQYPDSADYWDGNWLDVVARVEASGAFVETRGSFLRNDELAAFVVQLERVQRDLTGDAELACMEPNLHVKVRCVSMGRIEMVISITPDHRAQSHAFTFEIDQSYLTSTLRECRRILARLPVVGSITAKSS